MTGGFDDMTLPFEFVMPGPPVSQQARRRELVRQWAAIVRNTAGQDWRYLPVSTRELMVTITYLHRGDPIDVDNIPKPILDALKGLVYADDVAVTDLICRKLGFARRSWNRQRFNQGERSAAVLHQHRTRAGERCARPNGVLNMNDLEIRERNYIHAKAAEFRSLGYKVQQETPLEFMPDFIADLVVSKGDETTVIEVKSRTALAETPRITELAEILHNKPGWNFQLYWVGELGTTGMPPIPYDHVWATPPNVN